MARNRAAGLWVGRRATEGVEPPAPAFSMQIGRPFASTRYLITVADRDGRVIGELWGQLEGVNWRMDGYGQAALLAPPDLARDRPWLIEHGNRVLIEFENGLEPWGGVIDLPRETSAYSARVQMYQAAYVFNWRLLAQDAHYRGEWSNQAAHILRSLVYFRGDMNVYAEPISGEEGPTVDVTFGQEESVASAAGRLRDLDPAMHYIVKGRRENGRIEFYLNAWHGVRRDDSRVVALISGHNFVGATTMEQGPVFNVIRTAVPGRDAPWTSTESGSVARYGRREEWLTPTGVEEWGPAQAEHTAHNRLGQVAWPRLRTSGAALDLPPGRFRDYGVGSVVTLEAERPEARSNPAFIISMDYTPGDGTLGLVFDDTEERQ